MLIQVSPRRAIFMGNIYTANHVMDFCYQENSFCLGDGIGRGPNWIWSDGSLDFSYTNWEEGYPANLFTNAAQCAYLTSKNATWKNADCNQENGVPSSHICSAPKGT